MCKEPKTKALTQEQVELNRKKLCEDLSKSGIVVKTSDASSLEKDTQTEIFSGEKYYQKDKPGLHDVAKFFFALDEKYVPYKGGLRRDGKVIVACIVSSKCNEKNVKSLLDGCKLLPLE